MDKAKREGGAQKPRFREKRYTGMQGRPTTVFWEGGGAGMQERDGVRQPKIDCKDAEVMLVLQVMPGMLRMTGCGTLHHLHHPH